MLGGGGGGGVSLRGGGGHTFIGVGVPSGGVAHCMWGNPGFVKFNNYLMVFND